MSAHGDWWSPHYMKAFGYNLINLLTTNWISTYVWTCSYTPGLSSNTPGLCPHNEEVLLFVKWFMAVCWPLSTIWLSLPHACHFPHSYCGLLAAKPDCAGTLIDWTELYSQCRGCRWSHDAPSQGLSSRGIYIFSLQYSITKQPMTVPSYLLYPVLQHPAAYMIDNTAGDNESVHNISMRLLQKYHSRATESCEAYFLWCRHKTNLLSIC